MPGWNALGELLRAEVRFALADGGPIEVLSSYEAEHGRQALIARLRQVLNDGAVEPGAAHLAFARLPFDIVATTNFDALLEDSYRAVRRPRRTIVREDQLAAAVPANAVAVIKAHGDYDNSPVLVATEPDYDRFLVERPVLTTVLANLLITRVALLVGYSLSDANWRQVLAAIRTRLGREQQAVYALEVDPDPATVERFRRRGVIVIPLAANGRSYPDVYEDLFESLRSHVAAHALDGSTITDGGVLEELRAPRPEERHLILFLLSERRLAFFREAVFPVLRSRGFQPVTPYDVDALGRSLYAITTALVEEASAVVADEHGTDSGVSFEIGLALTARREDVLPVALVASGAEIAAQAPSHVQVIVDDPDQGDYGEGLPDRILNWVSAALLDNRPASTDAALTSARVLDDPAWVIVKSFRNLDLALRRAFPNDSRPPIQLLREATQRGRVEPALVRSVIQHRRLRNQIVHEQYDPISPDLANQIVSDVAAVVAALEVP